MTNQELAKMLRNWARGRSIQLKDAGICGNLQYVLPDTSDENSIHIRMKLRRLIRGWPETCGSADFPVGGADEYRAEQQARTLWKNPRRRQLCIWLAEQLERGAVK